MVKVFKLGLALVELIEIGLVQSNAGMRLIDFNTKFILNSLDSKILAQ